MTAFTEDNLEELQEYIICNYMQEKGANKASTMFQEIQNTLTSCSGEDLLTKSDVDSLAESY